MPHRTTGTGRERSDAAHRTERARGCGGALLLLRGRVARGQVSG